MNSNKIEKLMSYYLKDGYKQDVIEIKGVTFDTVDEKSRFRFDLNIKETFMSSQYGVFFSGITAEVWIYQACVVLAHLDNDLEENTREIVLQEKQLNYLNPVSPDNVFVSVTVAEKRTTSKGRIQYKFEVNVGDAITGSGLAIF